MRPARGAKELNAHERAALSAAADEIAAAYAASYQALAVEKEKIRGDIGREIGSTEPAEITAAYNGGAQATRRNDLVANREEYRVAMFEPGLSATQRRLLLAAAVESLGLELPRGEFQPTTRR